MPVTVTCKCGQSYDLKDDFAGKLVQCPECGAVMVAEATPPSPQADPAFDRDKFLLRQKHLAISEKYYVWNEQEQPILFVQRPLHLARNSLAVFAGLTTLLLTASFVGIAFAAVAARGNEAVIAAGVCVGIILGLVGGIAVGLALYVKRHVTFYRDDSKQEPLLTVLQDRKFQPINATYTLTDANGQLLARYRKNHLYNFIRKRWYCCAPDGSLICTAKEDSIILALLRRFLGPLLGFLRTNFLIYRGDGRDREVVGEFNRKFTILDRYVLDMSADPRRTIDRRVALALGVMLDTGERR